MSCRIAFLNRVSDSFERFSRSIRFGDVRFHFLLLEVCVARVCVCADFVRLQFLVKICACFVILSARGIDRVVSVVISRRCCAHG